MKQCHEAYEWKLHAGTCLSFLSVFWICLLVRVFVCVYMFAVLTRVGQSVTCHSSDQALHRCGWHCTNSCSMHLLAHSAVSDAQGSLLIGNTELNKHRHPAPLAELHNSPCASEGYPS